MPHVWITGDSVRDLAAAAGHSLPGLPGLCPALDAHRRLRGPYTATGSLLRALAPALLAADPELVYAHDIELLSVAPELAGQVPSTKETLTSLAVPTERTRFYARLRTLRIAHGLVELIRDHLVARGGGPRRLVVHNVSDADATDTEFLSVLLRRIDPALLTVVVCTTGDPADEALAAALRRYAEHRVAPPVPEPARAGSAAELAAEYVRGDCTSDEAALRAAYEEIDPAERAALHDARASELLRREERSLRLGAVVHHLTHGADVAGNGVNAVRAAMEYCVDMGFYDISVELAQLGRSLVGPAEHEQLWWAFTTKLGMALSILSRGDEAAEVYQDARALTTSPEIHQQLGYAMAMLYTRHHDNRDHRLAKAWINQSIAIATLRGGGFPVVFTSNGLALVETHLGNLPRALELVEMGITRLDAELTAADYPLHRSVLVYNRAQVLAAMGRIEEALADYDTVIERDPNYPEYHLDRGNLLHRIGRDEEALAEYAETIRLSPPFPEVHYNRADVLFDLGDLAGAAAELGYVLELEPENLDARINRAGALLALGQTAAAAPEIDAGLELAPDDPHLWCLRGQLLAERGESGAADAAYARALAADPELAQAWAGRAGLAFDAGDPGTAVRHLDRALDLGEDAALLYNRATARMAQGDYATATEDLLRAGALAPDDEDVRRDLATCRDQLTATRG